MDADRDAVPDDVAALKEALAVERAKGLEVAAELAVARAKASQDEAPFWSIEDPQSVCSQSIIVSHVRS
ncbi:hypothetical protein CO683_41500 [Bradyrhizobium ottawaense]|nr:hypothetical protein CO683_41500 [Bradyrhizobium ottawaense]